MQFIIRPATFKIEPNVSKKNAADRVHRTGIKNKIVFVLVPQVGKGLWREQIVVTRGHKGI